MHLLAAALLVILVQPALYLALLALGLEWKGRKAPPADARFDYAVVLGCRLREDGSAGPTLVRRTLAGARAVLEGRAETLILSGGVTSAPHSEAEAALSHALSAGLTREQILLEPRSRSTRENASEVAKLVADPKARVLLVTDAYHVPRSRRLFSSHFAHVDGLGVPDTSPSRVKNALREALVVVHAMATGRLD